MILITGATGHLGKTTIDFLLKKGEPAQNIVAFVRDENKASDLKEKGVTIKTGNYDDYDSMVNAFNKIEKLLLISGTDIGARLAQHKKVIDATNECGVKHIIYTSYVRNEHSENPDSALASVAATHIETDKYIKASGLPYTLMLNTLYADLLIQLLGNQIPETGILFPSGNGKVPYTTRADMAEANSIILMGSSEHLNKEYAITTGYSCSMHDIAQMLTDLSGKPVPFHPDETAYKEYLRKTGVPEMIANYFVGFARAIKSNEFDTNRSDLKKLLGREPTSLKAFLKSIYF